MREQTNNLIPHSSGSISFEGFSLQVLIDATLASLSLGIEFLTPRTSEYTHTQGTWSSPAPGMQTQQRTAPTWTAGTTVPHPPRPEGSDTSRNAAQLRRCETGAASRILICPHQWLVSGHVYHQATSATEADDCFCTVVGRGV